MRPQLNWIERLTTDQKVVGSIPAGRAIYFFSKNIGMQHSLVVHLIWDQGVAGSNPVIPTIILFNSAGQLSWLEHPVHTRKVVSSSLTPATNEFNLDPQLSWSEHPAHNRRVVGSSPTGSTNYTYAEVPKWLKGPVLKTGRSCERRLGSNPSFCAMIVKKVWWYSPLCLRTWVAYRMPNWYTGGNSHRGVVAVWQLVGLITRRSGVQIPPPQPQKLSVRISSMNPYFFVIFQKMR